MRSYKTKKIVASVMLATHLFTSAPIFANENINSNQKVIVEKSEINELQESLDKKDYVKFQKKYDELIKKGLIKGELIGNYAPVLGPKTQKAINNLKSNGYLLDEIKPVNVPIQETKIPLNEKETNIDGFKDEMKRTPYNEWDEKKQLEKSLTIFENKMEYLKLLIDGNKEYSYSYYIGERWLNEFNNVVSQLEAQYSKTLKYDNSKEKMNSLTQKYFSKNYEELIGSIYVIRTNAKYILTELNLMKEKLRNISSVQMNQIVADTKKEISGRLDPVLDRILILDSNKMSYLYDYSIKNNLKPNYLDVLEHVSNNKDFVNHKKWLTENYFKTVSFGDYNKDEVITAYNELSLGTQHALYEYYFNKNGKDNIPNSQTFALIVFGLNVQGYESGASIVNYLNRIERFDSKTQLEIYRRIGAGSTFAENESDWVNLNTYLNNDLNNALSKVLKTDIVMVRDQTKDKKELKSASIRSPGANVYEQFNSSGHGDVYVQEAFTLIEQNMLNDNFQVQNSNVHLSSAPYLNDTKLENSRPKGHSRNVDDLFGRNRIETSVPNSSVQIVKSVADLSVFNYRYIQKGFFSNLISNLQENFDYTKTTNQSETETNSIKNTNINYTNNLKGNLDVQGPSRYSNNELNWQRNKTNTDYSNETETQEQISNSEILSDTFSLISRNRNLFQTDNYGISLFELTSNVKVGETPNTYNYSGLENLENNDVEYTINKTSNLVGNYEYYLDSKLFAGWYENYSRGNFGENGNYNESKFFNNDEINKNETNFNKYKEWDFENIYNLKEWQLHVGTQQLNDYTNSLFFTGMYKGYFTIRPENSYYLKFGEIETIDNVKSKIHDYYKDGIEIPNYITMNRNVFDSNVEYHGTGGVIGIPFSDDEIGFGYIHNKTLLDQNKHLGIFSYSWNENSIISLSLYQGEFNIGRTINPYKLFINSNNNFNRNDLFNYKFMRDSKGINELYENNKQATFIEATLLNKDNLNVSAFAGSGEEYTRFQGGLIANYVHDLFKIRTSGIYDAGNENEKRNGAVNLYLANKKETAYLLASYIAQKELGWKTDDALRYLGEFFGLKVETKAYTSFSKNEKLNETGRFIGAEISFKNDLVVLYYFGGKDVYDESLENHKEFNLGGGQVTFTPNFSLESYGSWKGDLGNGAFIHPIITNNNNFGITALIGYSADKVNYNILNEKQKNDYLTAGLGIGFRKEGLSLLLLPISYTNNFDYMHVIETGLSGTYWLPGGSLGFGTGYVHNLIQNKTKLNFENPFSSNYINNNFDSRMFYLYGEGSARGLAGFDYTTFRLTGKLGENELYKLYQTIITLEMSDFWKRVYLDISFSYKMNKGNLIFEEANNTIQLNNLIEKYNIKGIIGIELYF